MKNLFADYYFHGGVLILESSHGDTLIPPFSGCYTCLEEASDEKDATRKAIEWLQQDGEATIEEKAEGCKAINELIEGMDLKEAEGLMMIRSKWLREIRDSETSAHSL